ncbi:immunity 63 family protein [Oscillospiraceae bacterium OttesenSCG-928-G22]|nr:immunity 63 family protein [Oscillospiraceae bacterium OttesenSCG-928-G22]
MLTNEELERSVTTHYEKVKQVPGIEEFFVPLDVVFRKNWSNENYGTYCYAKEDGYHYRTFGDKGNLINKPVTQSLVEITYRAIYDNVFWISTTYEVRHRVPGQDFRRLMFSKEMEMYTAIGPEYRDICETYLSEILEEVPYDDRD